MESEKEEQKCVSVMATSSKPIDEEPVVVNDTEIEGMRYPEFSKADILGVQDITVKAIDVPAWKCSLHIRVMRGWERDKWEQGITSNSGVSQFNFRAKLCAMVICDSEGERLFTDAEVQALGLKSSIALDTVFIAGVELNAVSEEDIDLLEKNS